LRVGVREVLADIAQRRRAEQGIAQACSSTSPSE
jgi:hypothetical protein